MNEKWNDQQAQLMNMPGKKYSVVFYKTALRYLTDYSKTIQWYAGCSFFYRSFLLKDRDRKKTDDATGDDGKIQKKRDEKIEYRNWKHSQWYGIEII